MPKVSVIIPLYNGKKYIRETLESVFSQTYDDFEVIVVDDGSTDDPKEDLAPFRDKIKFIRQKNSGCPAGAKNTGVRQAKGEYLAFLDQDDLWKKDKLQKQIDLFKKDQETLAVASNVGIIDGFGKSIIEKVWPNPEIWKNADIREKLSQGNIILTSSSVMIRRNFIEKYGFFNEKLLITDDFDMWYRVSRMGKLMLMPEVLTYWRMHSSNTSKMSEKTRVDTAMYYEELVKDNTLSKEEKVIASEWLKTMKIRLANYYLMVGRSSEALSIYKKYGSESRAVNVILKMYRLSPFLAKIIVRVKIMYSEKLVNKMSQNREIIFPGGGVI